eukprot:6917006-Ditylum_brightwellii.AAC.1
MDPTTNPFSILGDDDDNSKQGAIKPSKYSLANDEGKHHKGTVLDAVDMAVTSKDIPSPLPQRSHGHYSSFFTPVFEQSTGIKPEADIDNAIAW